MSVNMEREVPTHPTLGTVPLPITEDLWDNIVDLMDRFEQRTALTDLVYCDVLDAESKSLRAVDPEV
jgi:hypothetical protein